MLWYGSSQFAMSRHRQGIQPFTCPPSTASTVCIAAWRRFSRVYVCRNADECCSSEVLSHKTQVGKTWSHYLPKFVQDLGLYKSISWIHDDKFFGSFAMVSFFSTFFDGGMRQWILQLLGVHLEGVGPKLSGSRMLLLPKSSLCVVHQNLPYTYGMSMQIPDGCWQLQSFQANTATRCCKQASIS